MQELQQPGQAPSVSADPEAAIARVKRWQQANPERVNATQRARRAKPEAKLRERTGHLMRKYGMTIEQYDAMLDAQGGGCFICSRPPREDISLTWTTIM